MVRLYSEHLVSISIPEMKQLIHDCRTQNNNLGPKLSYQTITDICNHIRLPFLIEPLIKTGRPKQGAYTRKQAFDHLRSFGSGSGEFYFAEVMKPSVINIVADKTARARWIHQLIHEGVSKNDAIARIVKAWEMPPNSPRLNRENITRDYEEWLKNKKLN